MEVYMEKKTIGAFIAALRKSNGMTQQELADRLNVSNKAVSRWERDECAPDLSLIPALAEIFGVTCDELLKGERIFTEPQHKKEPKVEKQLRALINRSMSSFKTLILISLAISIVGLVCMFGISYGFYRPIIGFFVMLLFEICALVLAILAVNKAKEFISDYELLEEADSSLVAKFHKTLGEYSFFAFYVILAVILLSLPFVLITSPYIESVLAIQSYFTFFFSGIALILVFLLLVFKEPYIVWITESKLTEKFFTPASRVVKRMNCIQIISTIVAGTFFLLAPYFITDHDNDTIYNIALFVPVACLLFNIVSYIVFLAKYKNDRKALIIPGIRNMLWIAPTLYLSLAHSVSWEFYNEVSADNTVNTIVNRDDNWNISVILSSLWVALIIYLIFAIIERLRFVKNKITEKDTDICN